MRDDPKARQGAQAVVLLGGLGGGLAVLLWLAWVPSTWECGTVGECLSREFSGLLLTALAAVLGLVVLRLLHLRPVFLTTLLAFVGAGALVLSLEEVTSVAGAEGLAPWWSWLLIGIVIAPLAHWVLQVDRGWWARVLSVLAVTGLAFAGPTWAHHERDQDQLEQLAQVQVAPVLRPDLVGYRLAGSYGASSPDGDVRYIRMSLRPRGSSTGQATGYQLPLQGRDPCELVMALEYRARDGECRSAGQTVALEGDDVAGAGVVREGTFLLLTGTPRDFTVEQLREAALEARPSSLEELRDGVIP